jgi:hypothetical protein
LLSQVFISLDEIKIILVSTRNEIKAMEGEKIEETELKLKNKDRRYPFVNLVSSNIEVKI